MSIIKKMETILSEGDTAAAEQLIQDDYQFLMNSTLAPPGAMCGLSLSESHPGHSHQPDL